MMYPALRLCLVVMALRTSAESLRCKPGLKFPPNFAFGAASASYQVEGAWNISDKGESMWDRLTHDSDKIADDSNGDVACDSYHNYKTDVNMLKHLGVDFYRMSLSWTRILPTGFPNIISEDGVRYYNELIDELLANDIKPAVTIYHWDLPQTLQDLGGWTNPYIAQWFGDYARVVFRLFGDRVKTWLTINEPIGVCDVSYESGITAPGILSPGIGNLLCGKHIHLAHATCYRIYDEEFRSHQQGKVSIVNFLIWFEPHLQEYKKLTNLVRDYGIGRFCDPIYSKKGGWPENLVEYFNKLNETEHYARSRLPAFSAKEIEFVKGTYDFFGFNFYTCRTILPARENTKVKQWPFLGCPALRADYGSRPNWKKGGTFWFLICPEGIRKQLNLIKHRYGKNIEILITENGCPTKSIESDPMGLQDYERCDYYRDHLNQVLRAIHHDGVKVIGYTAWTLMDNFEWFDGYTTKFGLYAVDFNHPNRTRTPRLSAEYFKHIVSTRSVVDARCVVKSDLNEKILLK